MPLVRGPLHDPKSKVRRFRNDEHFGNMQFDFLGSGMLYKDPNFNYYLGKDLEWKRPKEICGHPYFIREKPDRFDALQGHLGDCYFLAAVQSLTLHDNLIKHVVPPDQSFYENYAGMFHFRFWKLGSWYDVVVDDRLPVCKRNNQFKLCYGHSRSGDVFWAALLEKAYSKFYGDTMLGLKSGILMMALQDLSGAIVERVLTDSLPLGTTIKFFLNEVFSGNALMGCVCYEGINAKQSDLRQQHGYSITSLFKCEDDDPIYPGLFLIRILEPAGKREWQGEWSDGSQRWREIDREIRQKLNFVVANDGEFWMNEIDFVVWFQKIYIGYLGPSEFEKSHHGNAYVRNWKTTTFYGEWVTPYSSGGTDLSSRHINPQYRIMLKQPDNDINRDGTCNVVMELTNKTKQRRSTPDNVFYIYSLVGVSNPPMPLDEQFFLDHKPVNEEELQGQRLHDELTRSEGTSYLVRQELDPGTYCIVPCTRYIHSEAQFLLRVFSENFYETWEYDTKISKSMPKESEEWSQPDEGIQKLFLDIADSKGEIDWIGLKEILGKSMNDSSFLFIETIFKLTWKLFERFLPFSSSDDVYSGEIAFSKDDCRSMIGMLDDNRSGKLSFSEFSRLWNKICFWTKVYKHHSDETQGWLAVSQLRDALSSIGFNLSRPIIHIIIHRYANENQHISLEDFILCGVSLETGISLYQKKAVQSEDKTTFTLEEWVKDVLFL